MNPVRRFFNTRIYRATRRWRHGREPFDAESLIMEPGVELWAIPTFRYVKVWPWDRQRPHWLRVYALPDFTPTSGNILPYPERRALNVNGPEERYNNGRGDVIAIQRSTRGATVWDARFSAHGRQHSSDVWCLLVIPCEWLRHDLEHDPSIERVVHGDSKYFLAWAPAIWLAPAY